MRRAPWRGASPGGVEAWETAAGRERLVGLLAQSYGGHNLERVGLTGDFEAVALVDHCDCVPELDPTSWVI